MARPFSLWDSIKAVSIAVLFTILGLCIATLVQVDNTDSKYSAILNDQGDILASLQDLKTSVGTIQTDSAATSPTSTPMISAYPWEVVQNNQKTWKFIVKNFDTTDFAPLDMVDIVSKVQAYINDVVFLTWRLKVDIQLFTPPSVDSLEALHVLAHASFNRVIAPDMPTNNKYIPIWLVNEFNANNVANNFTTAVHGCVSGTIDMGKTPTFYLNQTIGWALGIHPMGFPFIIIPAGSESSGNGIQARVLSNQQNGDGPTTFKQTLAHTLASEIMAVLINPTKVNYILSGDPLGRNIAQTDIQFKATVIYQKDIVAPFSRGLDNIVTFAGYSMPNFAFPAYFIPFDVRGIYDYLGNSIAPFTPWKGTQLAMYQVNTGDASLAGKSVSDLQLGYVERGPLDASQAIRLSLYGSIYDYAAWGWTYDPIAQAVTAGGTSVSPTVLTFTQQFVGASNVNFDKTVAQESSTFFVDPEDGILTMRFGIVNFAPSLLSPAFVAETLPILERNIKRYYTPLWNIKVKFVGNWTIYQDSDQPTYDGTWTPYFVTQTAQWNFQSIGTIGAYSGAFNTANNFNPYTGPLVSDYLAASWTNDLGNVITLPNLPLTQPYIAQPTASSGHATMVNTNVVGVTNLPAYIVGGAQTTPPLTPFPWTNLGVQQIMIVDPVSPDPNLSLVAGKLCLLYRPISSGITLTFFTRTLQLCESHGAVGYIIAVGYGGDVLSGGGAHATTNIVGVIMSKPNSLAFLAALTSNPGMTVSVPVGTPNLYSENSFPDILSHEVMEELRDPAYAEYIGSMVFPSSPSATDGAIVFNQIQNGDEDEVFVMVTTDDTGTIFKLFDGFPFPCYFIPNLKCDSYDFFTQSPRPLVPASRNQVFFQLQASGTYQPDDGSSAYVIDSDIRASGGVLTGYEGAGSTLDFIDGGSMYVNATFYPPYINTVDYFVDGKSFSVYNEDGSNQNIGPITRVYTETLRTGDVTFQDNIYGYLAGPLNG